MAGNSDILAEFPAVAVFAENAAECQSPGSF